MEYKQVILVRMDLKLPKGKLAAQAAHASVSAVLKQQGDNRDAVKYWNMAGMKKIAVKVANEKELYKYVQQAKDKGLVTAVITDAGKTVVAPGTVTCAAIGPEEEDDVHAITGELPLL